MAEGSCLVTVFLEDSRESIVGGSHWRGKWLSCKEVQRLFSVTNQGNSWFFFVPCIWSTLHRQTDLHYNHAAFLRAF